MRIMKYFAIVVGVSFIIFLTFNYKLNTNSSKTNSLQELNINGNVRIITSTQYGNRVEKGTIVDDDLTDYITVVEEYDEHGMSTNQFIYDMNGKVIDQTLWSYNKNNLLSRIEFSNYNIHGCTKMEYHFNKNNELIRMDLFDRESMISQSVIITYYSSGYKHMEHFLDENGEETYVSEFIYNDNNVLVKSLRHDIVNNHKSKTIYEYDSNGNIVLEKTVDDNGNITFIYEREYDKNNNLLKYNMLDGEQVINSETYVYIYDNLGNWIEKSVFIGNEKVKHIIRDIEYY